MTDTPTPRRVRASYVPVVLDGRLVFRYDPHRGLVEIQHRGVRHVVDLAAIDAAEQAVQGDGKAQDGANPA